MKWTLVVVMSLLALSPAIAGDDIRATTDDGKRVILHPDGKWSYDKQDGSALPGLGRAKPATATAVLKSKRGFFEIWYDPNKWESAPPENKAAEFELNHSSGDAASMALSERLTMSLDALKGVAISNARDAAPDAVIESEEEVIVNGVKMMALKINGSVEGIPFTYYGYYWTGEAGTLQCIAFTGRNLFNEFSKDITELLNGLVITKRDK